jgi:hypothetical protein
VLKLVLAPMLLFAMGFLPGLFISAHTSPWRFRAVVCVVLFSPIVVLILLRYIEAVDPDTVSALFVFLPRAIELPLLGFLVGYGLHTLLSVGQATESSSWLR